MGELREHLWKPFPQGWFCGPREFEHYKREFGFWTITIIAVMFTFFWALVNVPELFVLCVIYLFMACGACLLVIPEILEPLRWFAAIPRPVGIYGKAADATIGLVVGFIFACLLGAAGATYPLMPISLFENLLLVGICIPITEEYLFNKFNATTIERSGIVPGILALALIFSLFHWGVYHQIPVVLTVLFAYRAVCGVVITLTKSFSPSIIAHIVINSLAVIAHFSPPPF